MSVWPNKALRPTFFALAGLPIALRAMLLLGLWLAPLSAVGADGPAAEAQRIEYLIRSIEQLTDAKFIRNDSAYDGKAAAEHLRLKWREAGARIKTAQQFIELCGSKSSVSGRPYQIRFAEGTLLTSEAFLREKLKELDGSSQ
jgi:hypothetical protein